MAEKIPFQAGLVSATCVELSSAVGVLQLSLAPGACGVQWLVERLTAINVQNSFGGFGPSGQTREGSIPLKGDGPSLFGPWEFLAGGLRPCFGRWPWIVAVG